MNKHPIYVVLLTASTYFIIGKLSQLIVITPGFPTPVWPAAGVALMMVLRMGPIAGVGVWLGSFSVISSSVFFTHSTFSMMQILYLPSLMALGALFEALLGRFLIQRTTGFPLALNHPVNVFYLLFLGGPIACLSSATLGTLTLYLTIPNMELSAGATFMLWWFGDWIGVILVLPLSSVWKMETKENPFRRKMVVVVPVLSSVFATLLAFAIIQSYNLKKLTHDFTRQSEIIFHALQTELKETIDTLYSIKALFKASREVKSVQFQELSQPLIERHQGIQALEWIPRVTKSQRKQFEKRIRQDRSTPFSITEQDVRGRLIAARERDEYFPVTYVTPLKGNEAALGFDLSSNPLRQKALQHARKILKPVATAPIPLVQAPSPQKGILIFLPITLQGKDPIDGFCLGVFKINEMVTLALKLFNQTRLNFYIQDITSPDTPLPVYNNLEPSLNFKFEGGTQTGPMEQPSFIKSFEFAERRWEVTFFPTTSFLSQERDWKVWAVLTGGFLFTGLLAGLLLYITGRSFELSKTVARLKREMTHRKKTKNALDRSELQFRKLVESAPDAILIMTSKGVIDFANQQVHTVFGYEPDELTGKPHDILIPKELKNLHRAHQTAFFDKPRIRPMSDLMGLYGQKKNGERVPVEITLSPFESRGALSVICIIRDITQRLKYEESLHQKARELSTLYQTGKKVGASLSMTDVAQKTVESISASVSSDITLLFLREKEMLTPMSYHTHDKKSAMGERDPHPVGTCLCGLAAEGGKPIYSKDLKKDPRCTGYECKDDGIQSFAALPLVGKEGIIGILGMASKSKRDFTKEKNYLETLSGQIAIALENAILYKRLNNLAGELEKRVEERTRELSIEKERAESADRLKSAFLASMSHELRTPLNSIIGFTDIISEEMVGPLNDEQKKQMGMVNNSANHLLHLINDILDLSKIESGQLKLEAKPFDYVALTKEVQHAMTPLANKKGVSLLLEIAHDIDKIKSDERRIKQILINLVNNAVKFTEEGSVKIKVTQEASQLLTRITDTGIGIEKKNLSTIFSAFRQVETNFARKYEGTGLGLTICHKLITLLKGDITVISDGLGRGCTFTLRLPIG